MSDPSSIAYGCLPLIGFCSLALIILSNVSRKYFSVVALCIYVVFWVVLLTNNIITFRTRKHTNATVATISFISSVTYFTIVGSTVILIRLCPGIVSIFDHSISQWLLTKTNNFREDWYINSAFNITGYAKDEITAQLTGVVKVGTDPDDDSGMHPDFPIHLAVPFLKMGPNEGEVIVDTANSITQYLNAAFNNEIIFKLLKQLNAWSLFIIMTFSYLVAFMVSYIAITIENN